MAAPVNFIWNPTAHSQVFLCPQDTHNRNEMHRLRRWKVSILFILCFLYNTPNRHVSSGHRTGKGQFSFQSQRKVMPKNAPTTTQLHSSHMLAWRRQWHPTPVLLPGNSHGWRSLVGCSPWGCEESDTTERLHILFSLSCIGEGNGNPLQCSCLENPRDGRAW